MKKILSILTISSSLFASGCWTTKEDANMADLELDGNVAFSFKDAVTCKPITNAKVNFLGKSFKTDYKGQIIMPIPPKGFYGQIPLKLTKKGYITLNQNILAAVESYWNTKFLVSKDLSINSMRFVLSWGEIPKDLDLHLVSNKFNISYRTKKSFNNEVFLDRDAKKGYGAETITLKKVNPTQTYKVYVYNYSNETPFSGKANVAIYKNNSLDKVVPIKSHSRCVEIAEIHNKSITYTLKGVSNSHCK